MIKQLATISFGLVLDLFYSPFENPKDDQKKTKRKQEGNHERNNN
jgi:hypothetical protein